MNGYLGYPNGTVLQNRPPFRPIQKLSNFTCPGTLGCFVFLDEHENSINDSHFTPFANLKSFTDDSLDTPSGRHGNSTGFVFADGHAEIHKWIDSDIQKAVYGPGVSTVYNPDIVGKAGPVKITPGSPTTLPQSTPAPNANPIRCHHNQPQNTQLTKTHENQKWNPNLDEQSWMVFGYRPGLCHRLACGNAAGFGRGWQPTRPSRWPFPKGLESSTTNAGYLGGLAIYCPEPATNGYPKITNTIPVGAYVPSGNSFALSMGTVDTTGGGRAVEITTEMALRYPLGGFIGGLTISGWLNSQDKVLVAAAIVLLSPWSTGRAWV